MPKIERGMLLLAPPDRGFRATIWTVTSESRRTIVSHSHDIKAEATLSSNEIPAYWRVLDNHALAERLMEETDA